MNIYSKCIIAIVIVLSMSLTTYANQPNETLSCVSSDIENEGWYDNCNWCSCTGSGSAFCTLKGCLGRSELDMTCKGDVKWKLRDGSWLQCINEVGVTIELETPENSLPAPAN